MLITCVYILQVIDRCGPAEMLRLLLQHDKAFASVQEQHQEQYNKLCQTLKKAQRYPVSYAGGSIWYSAVM